MNMNVNQLSSTQFEVTLNWESISLVFTIIRNSTNRTANILFNRISGTSLITQNVACLIECNDSQGRLMQILDTTYSASQIRNGVSLATPSYPAYYAVSGKLDLLMTINFNPYESQQIDFSTVSALFNLPELYTEPSATISSIIGTLNYNGITYVNLGDTISFHLDANSDYNTCIPEDSYVGIQFRRSGLPNIIKKYYTIDDNGKDMNIIIDNVPYSDLNAYDKCDVFLYVIRKDSRGISSSNSYYLGYLYTLPRLINPKIEVHASDSSLNYNLTNYYGSCILQSTSSAVEFKLSYDIAMGDLSVFAMDIIYDNVSIASEKILTNNKSVFVKSSEITNLKLDLSQEYTVIFIPISSKNIRNQNQKVTSRSFKLLKHLEYSFSGTDTNPILNTKFEPLNANFNYLDGEHASVNANTEITFTKETVISSSELHNSISMCYVRPVIMQYSAANRILNENIVYCNAGYGLENAQYETSVLDFTTYANVLSVFEVPNHINNKFFLMQETVIIINQLRYTFYQYVSRLCFVPEVFPDTPIHVRSNNYSIRMIFNELNNYGSHQNGIISKYNFRMKDGIQVLYNGFSDSDEMSFPIPEQTISGKYYTFSVNLFYTENNIDYQYTYDLIYFKSRIDKQEITDVPDIIYPTFDNDNPYCCYSYYEHPYFIAFIQLPKVQDGTSGTPSIGDDVYSDMKIVINGYEKLYSNYTELFIGELRYLERIIFIIDTEQLGIPASEAYNIKIYVKQNYGGINAYGDYAEINATGKFLKPVQDRLNEDYNGLISYNLYKNIYDVMAGFCKSYAAYSSSEDPPTVVDRYAKGIGEIIYADDFNALSMCVKETIHDVNLWLTEVTTTKTKIIDDGIVFEAIPLTMIKSALEFNYIEQMYDWIQYIYNQIKYEPEENFITYDNSDGTSCTIIMYIGHNESVRIPPTIRGKTVTHLGEISFNGNQTLEKVILPNTSVSIDPELQLD